jgi:hypothetical protein
LGGDDEVATCCKLVNPSAYSISEWRGPMNPPTTVHVNRRSLHLVYTDTLATIDFQILFSNIKENWKNTPKKPTMCILLGVPNI